MFGDEQASAIWFQHSAASGSRDMEKECARAHV